MILRGIVEYVSESSNVCRVRIPEIHKSAGATGATSTSDLGDSAICTIPNFSPNLRNGDIVFVGFENDDISNPVVLGVLYTKEMSETYGDLAVNDLTVNKDLVINGTFNLYKDSKNVCTDTELAYLERLSGNVEDRLNQHSKDISTLEKKTSDISYDLSSVTNSLSAVSSSLEEAVQSYRESDLSLEERIAALEDSINMCSKDIESLYESVEGLREAILETDAVNGGYSSDAVCAKFNATLRWDTVIDRAISMTSFMWLSTNDVCRWKSQDENNHPWGSIPIGFTAGKRYNGFPYSQISVGAGISLCRGDKDSGEGGLQECETLSKADSGDKVIYQPSRGNCCASFVMDAYDICSNGTLGTPYCCGCGGVYHSGKFWRIGSSSPKEIDKPRFNDLQPIDSVLNGTSSDTGFGHIMLVADVYKDFPEKIYSPTKSKVYEISSEEDIVTYPNRLCDADKPTKSSDEQAGYYCVVKSGHFCWNRNTSRLYLNISGTNLDLMTTTNAPSSFEVTSTVGGTWYGYSSKWVLITGNQETVTNPDKEKLVSNPSKLESSSGRELANDDFKYQLAMLHQSNPAKAFFSPSEDEWKSFDSIPLSAKASIRLKAETIATYKIVAGTFDKTDSRINYVGTGDAVTWIDKINDSFKKWVQNNSSNNNIRKSVVLDKAVAEYLATSAGASLVRNGMITYIAQNYGSADAEELSDKISSYSTSAISNYLNKSGTPTRYKTAYSKSISNVNLKASRGEISYVTSKISTYTSWIEKLGYEVIPG